MSYIHDALKKAQKEKEAHSRDYQGVVEGGKGEARWFSGRRLWRVAVALIPLAFAVYLWLPSGDSKPPPTKSPGPDRRPRAERPQDAAVLYEKARLYQKKGVLKEAARLYEETLKVAPEHAEALNNLGVIRIQNRDFPGARQSFTRALRVRPDFVDAQYNLACLSALEGRTSESLAFLRKAVALDPSVRAWARKDTDLRNLRGMREFNQIVKERRGRKP